MNDDAGCLGAIAFIAMVVAAFAMLSCQDALHEGACGEAWNHAVTQGDTIALVRRECSLPVEAAK